MRLLKIKTAHHGEDIAINPRYITSVFREARQFTSPGNKRDVTVIEYEGNAGYRTKTCYVDEPLEDIVARIEVLD